MRDEYWDTLKFVLIFFVVYAHTIETYAPNGSINRTIYNFIYMFHMPLFVFVSGRYSQISNKEKYKKGIISLFETYIVFQIIWQLIRYVGGKAFFLHFIIFPNWTLWYLVSLIWWRIMIYVISEKTLKERPFEILTLSFLISIIGGWIPVDSHFSLQRTMAFMPFFFMGYYSIRIDIRKYVNKIPLYLAFFVIVTTFTILFFYINYNINFVLTNRLSYWSNPNCLPIFRCLARCVYIVSAIVMSLVIMRIIPLNKMMAKWGSNTLFIYMYHTFLIRAFRIGVNKNLLPNNELLLIAYAFCFCFVLAYLSRFKFPNIMLKPFTYLKEKSNKNHSILIL